MKLCLFILVSFALYCSSESSNIQNHLGSRTPYRLKGNKNDSQIKYPNCKDSKIWMVIRHGTRYPNAKDITKINTRLKELKLEILLRHRLGKGELSDEQIKKIENWTWDLDLEKEKFLTLEGQDEMIILAERTRKRFPGAVKEKYNNQTFLFRYTATQRAQQSARYFANGLFDKKEAQDVLFSPAAKVDTVLRFYKHCDKWQKQVKKNPLTYTEQKLYGISKEMNDTIKSVTKRLGLKNLLSLDDVNLMYKACGFETSWNKHFTSPWCYPFDVRSVQTMEYYQDLKYYWMDGYGHDLTYRQACVSIKNMFENFSSKGGPSASFLFTHSGTILKILTHLELFKPRSHLRGDKNVPDRTWRASDIDCFGANLALVLYRCKGVEYVLALHQERVVKLPMCEKELCPLKTLKEYFHKSIYECDYTDMCSLKKDDL